MYSQEDLLMLIQKKVEGFCRVNGDEPILQPVNYLMQLGGKRMRPLLSLMAANLFSDEIEEAVYPALAIEVFHNFTLMHDDIMDRAPLRRGHATVHEKWNTSTAILSGDAMMIQANQLMCKAPDRCLRDVLNVFSKTAIEVCIGQQRDMEFENRTGVSMEEYIEMIRLKTSVLLGGAMQIGAIIANADATAQHHIYSFGENLGIAFQLCDDYLDAYGDETKVGKLRGGDIIADKKTFLLIKALELADENQRRTLQSFEGDTTQKVNAVIDVFEQLDLKKQIFRAMDGYFEKAISALNEIQADESRKEPLRSFALYIMQRKH